jgi:hypothetical protein
MAIGRRWVVSGLAAAAASAVLASTASAIVVRTLAGPFFG